MLTPEQKAKWEQYKQETGFKPASTAPTAVSSISEGIARKKAELEAAKPKLGDGVVGEFGAGFDSAILKPGLKAVGAIVNNTVDQGIGRAVNAVQGKGFEKTHLGDTISGLADNPALEAPDTLAGKSGEVVGNVLPYFTPVGAEKAAVAATGLLPKIASFAAKAAPEFAKDAAIGTIQTGNPVEGAGIAAGGTVLRGAGELVGNMARGAADLAKGKFFPSPEQKIEAVIDIVSPKVTPVKGANAIKSGKAEVQEPGLFTPGKVSYANNPRMQKVAEVTQDVIDPTKSMSENFNGVRSAIEETAENEVKPFLSANKVPFNFEDLRGRLSLVQPDSTLKADAAAFSTYGRVREEMLGDIANFLRKDGGTENLTDMNALWDARKAIDARIERELGQAAFGTPQYTGAKAAARDMRTAINQFITDSLTNPGQAATMNKFYDFLGTARSKGISIANEGEAMTALRHQFGLGDFEEDVAKAAFYKTKMEEMNLMYEALDNMAPKALAEVNKTGLQLWIKQHPVAAKALGFLAGGALAGLGFGAAANINPAD